MAQFEKGQEVWYFQGYDRKATVRATRLTIQSFGKKQGTATYTEQGKMLTQRLYADLKFNDLVPVADVANIEAECLRRAAIYKAENIKHYVDCQHAYCDSLTPFYHEHMKRECEAVIAAVPSFVVR